MINHNMGDAEEVWLSKYQWDEIIKLVENQKRRNKQDDDYCWYLEKISIEILTRKANKKRYEKRGMK